MPVSAGGHGGGGGHSSGGHSSGGHTSSHVSGAHVAEEGAHPTTGTPIIVHGATAQSSGSESDTSDPALGPIIFIVLLVIVGGMLIAAGCDWDN